MYAKDVSTVSFFTVFFILARLECYLGYKLVRILSGVQPKWTTQWMNNPNQTNLDEKEFFGNGWIRHEEPKEPEKLEMLLPEIRLWCCQDSFLPISQSHYTQDFLQVVEKRELGILPALWSQDTEVFHLTQRNFWKWILFLLVSYAQLWINHCSQDTTTGGPGSFLPRRGQHDEVLWLAIPK